MYKTLKAWQASFNLVKRVHQLTNHFPKHELYGLTLQIRRCAVSVPSNIAEGFGRGTSREYLHFLFIARGSLCELETQLMLANELGYLDYAIIQSDIEESLKLLNGFIRKKRQDLSPRARR